MQNTSIPSQSPRFAEEKPQTSLFVELQPSEPKGLILLEFPSVPTLSGLMERIASIFPTSGISNPRAQSGGDTWYLMEENSLELLVRHSKLSRVRICVDRVALPPRIQAGNAAARQLFAVILEDTYNKL